jgi:hypothetical protein
VDTILYLCNAIRTTVRSIMNTKFGAISLRFGELVELVGAAFGVVCRKEELD